MKRLLAIVLVFFFTLIFKPYLTEAQQIPAYIDYDSGIVIGRGETVAKEGVSTSHARQQAIDEAKKNILIVLERQNIEVKDKDNRIQYTTIGKYLALQPEKKHIVNQFLDTASVIKETVKKDGAVQVTISLLVEGDSGLRALLNWLEGKQESPPPMTASAHENITAARKTDTTMSQPDEVLQKVTEPYSIALFTFENLTNYQAIDLGSEFVQRLKNQFKRDRRFVFLSPGESRKILGKNKTTEEELKNSDITETIPIEGTDGLILGSITRYEPEIKKHGVGGAGYLEIKFHMTLDMRILDARSGKWVFYEEIPITVEDRTFTLKSADDADKFILMND
ncbi:MAG: CsgG/HfaB family protein, partial [bacterium]